MLWPDRQAFFERLALSLPPQPAIKIGPRANAWWRAQTGIADCVEGGAGAEAEHGATKHGVPQMITEISNLDKVRSREPLYHGISQDYLTKEAPQQLPWWTSLAKVFL